MLMPAFDGDGAISGIYLDSPTPAVQILASDDCGAGTDKGVDHNIIYFATITNGALHTFSLILRAPWWWSSVPLVAIIKTQTVQS